MVADYPDYDALNLVLAAIGSPAQSGGKSLLDVINELSAVISQIQTGSPNITNPTLLANSGFLKAIAASGVDTYGPFATPNTSYTVSFSPAQFSAGTKPSMVCGVVITDSAANVVDTASWDMPIGAGGGQVNYNLGGPINAGNITVQVINSDSVGGNYTMTLTTSNLPIFKHSALTQTFAAVNNYTVPPNTYGNELILATFTVTVAAGATKTYLIPPSSGNVQITIRAHNNPANMLYQLYMLTQADSYLGVSGAPIWSALGTSNAPALGLIPMPRCGTILTMKNNGTNGDICDVGIVGVPT